MTQVWRLKCGHLWWGIILPITLPEAKPKAGAERCKIIYSGKVRNRGEPCKLLGDSHLTDSRKSTKLAFALITQRIIDLHTHKIKYICWCNKLKFWIIVIHYDYIKNKPIQEVIVGQTWMLEAWGKSSGVWSVCGRQI